MSSTNLRSLGGSKSEEWIDSPGSWARVAAALSGCPNGFCLLQHSPLGWACPPSRWPPLSFASSVVLTRDSAGNSAKAGWLSFLLRTTFPHVWFAVCTPYVGTRADKKQMSSRTLELLSDGSVHGPEMGSRWMHDFSGNRTNQMSANHTREKKKIAEDIIADQKTGTLRFLAWCLTKVFLWLFGGDIFVDNKGLLGVKEMESTHTLVYVPTHKSHLDYLVMSYILFSSGLTCPHIVAGDNLNIPIIGNLMRRCGAFFIRRSMKPGTDVQMYKQILAGYMKALVMNGVPLEFFIEGGRCRDGIVNQPKLGILSNLVDIFFDANLQSNGNIAIIPVSISYDYPPEESHLIRENLGGVKQPESLWRVAKAFVSMVANHLFRKNRSALTGGQGGQCGSAVVAFGQPIILTKFFKAQSGNRVPQMQKSSQALLPLADSTTINRRNSLDLGLDDDRNILQAVYPQGSDFRKHGVQVLGTMIHSQLRKIHVLTSSVLVVCGGLLQSIVLTEQKLSTSMAMDLQDVAGMISWLDHIYTRMGGRGMSLCGQGGSELGKQQIIQVAKKMPSTFALSDQSSKYSHDPTHIQILRTPVAYLSLYYRLVQVLGVVGPQAIVSCAIIAVMRGFPGKLHWDEFNGNQSQNKTVLAPKDAILEASHWIRYMLAGDLDNMIGAGSFRERSSFLPILNQMIQSGDVVVHSCRNTRTNIQTTGLASRPSSMPESVPESQQGSIGGIVDLLIGEVIEDTGRRSCEESSKKTRNISADRNVRNLRSRKSVAIMEWAGRDAPVSSWSSAFLPSARSSNESDQSTNLSGDDIDSISAYSVEKHSPAQLYAYLLAPILSTYCHLFNNLYEFVESCGDDNARVMDSKIMPYLHQELCKTWHSGDGAEGAKIIIPAQTLVKRFTEMLRKVPMQADERTDMLPFPLLVRSTPVQQNGAPCPPSRSSLDYRVSIDDSMDMKVATGNRASQQSWEPSVPHDRIRLCRELRDEAGRKLMMKRLEMFVPTS